jgi:DNA-binding NarL/FixJ family response regulator
MSWQKNFRRFLRNEPFNVAVAATSHEALSLYEPYALDVLILDVNLSGVPYNVDGLHVAEQMWRKNKNLKIIIVSGSREWDKRLRAYNFIPSFIIDKQSLDQDDLIRKIYQAVHN